jgi:hypothetical protein
MYPIVKGLVALTLTGASILGVGKVTTEVVESVTQPVVPAEIVVAPTTVAPKPTVPPTTTLAPEFVDEDKKIQVEPTPPPLTVDEARLLYGKCGEWRELALMVGWPAEEWGTLSYVLHRESRCNIGSHNKTDPMSGSRGLMQINGYWCKPTKYSANGWLQDHGILTTCDDLYDPVVNLRAGLAIWLYGEGKHGCGWRGPWATPCDRYN